MKVIQIFCFFLFLNLGFHAENFDKQLAKLPEKERLVFLNKQLEGYLKFSEFPYRKYAEYALTLASDVYSALSELSLAMNNPAEALKFNRLADTLKKNLLGPQVTGPIMNLLMKYEKEKYGQEIIKRQNLLIIFSLIVILLLVILLLIYRLQRQRARRKNISYEQLLAEQRLLLENMKTVIREMDEKEGPKKYGKSKLSLGKAHDCLQRLITIMAGKKKYLDPELSLKSLSEILEVNTSYLSQIINEHLGKNFTDYVNQFRVEEAKKKLSDPKHKKSSLTDIAFQSGFNSIPSFNRVFKKLTGLNPSQFSHDFSVGKSKGKKQAKGNS
jgi:AraC-like DNA-binding protein